MKALSTTIKRVGEVGKRAFRGITRAINSTLGRLAALTAGYVSLRLAIREASQAADLAERSSFISTVSDFGEGQARDAILRESVRTGGDINKLTGGLEEAARAYRDFDSAQALFREGNRLAVANMGEVSDAVALTSQVLKTYELGVESSRRVTSLLNVAAKGANADITELRRAFGGTVPVLAEMGVSFEEVVAAVGSAGAQGLRASQTLTGLRSAIRKLEQPTERIRDLVRQQGIELGDNVVKQEGLIKTLRAVVQASRDAGVNLQQLGIEGEAQAAILAIVGDEGGRFNKVLGDLSTSTEKLDEDYQKLNSSANSTFGTITNIIRSFTDELFGQAIKDVNEEFGRLVKNPDELALAVRRMAVDSYAAFLRFLDGMELLGRGFSLLIAKAKEFGSETKLVLLRISESVLSKNEALIDRVLESSGIKSAVSKSLGGLFTLNAKDIIQTNRVAIKEAREDLLEAREELKDPKFSFTGIFSKNKERGARIKELQAESFKLFLEQLGVLLDQGKELDKSKAAQKEIRDAIEEINRGLERSTGLRASISEAEKRALKIAEKSVEAADKELERLKLLEDEQRRINSLAQQYASSIASGVTSAIDQLISRTATLREVMGQLLRDIARFALQSAVQKGVGALLAGPGQGLLSLLTAANGAVFPGSFSPLPFQAFASGGVSNGPTLGLIGEGRFKREAVVPLPDGRNLPVDLRGAGGGGGGVLILSVTTPDKEGTRRFLSSPEAFQTFDRWFRSARATRGF